MHKANSVHQKFPFFSPSFDWRSKGKHNGGMSEYKTQLPCKSSLYFNKQPLKAILHRFSLDEAKSAFRRH